MEQDGDLLAKEEGKSVDGRLEIHAEPIWFSLIDYKHEPALGRDAPFDDVCFNAIWFDYTKREYFKKTAVASLDCVQTQIALDAHVRGVLVRFAATLEDGRFSDIENFEIYDAGSKK